MLPYTSFSFLAELFSFSSSKFFKEEFFKSDFSPCSVSVRILSSLEERVLFLVVLLSCIIMLHFSARGVLHFSAISSCSQLQEASCVFMQEAFCTFLQVVFMVFLSSLSSQT